MPEPGETAERLAVDCARLGIGAGDVVMVHASIRALGQGRAGAAGLLAALRDRVGAGGLVIAPAFTSATVCDPTPWLPLDSAESERRAEVAPFTALKPSDVGAWAQSVQASPAAVRSTHPQASLCAVGDAAASLLAIQPWSYALGHGSPLASLAGMDAKILLVGVGYDRMSYLHHIESTIRPHRRKERRFPIIETGRRRWVAATDVADDNGRLFPAAGRMFETESTAWARDTIGEAPTTLIDVHAFHTVIRPWVAHQLQAIIKNDGHDDPS